LTGTPNPNAEIYTEGTRYYVGGRPQEKGCLTWLLYTDPSTHCTDE